MSAPVNKPRPGLRFTWLGIITLGLVALIACGAIWSSATWTPKLALDLEGGTSIILEPEIGADEEVTPEQLDQAVSIIRQRIDSTGVSEAQISTQGDRNIVVNLPGTPDEETLELVRSAAQLNFRRVALVGAPGVAGEDTASSSATSEAPLSEEDQKKVEDALEGDSEAPAPEETATGGGDVTPEATASDTATASPAADGATEGATPSASPSLAPAEDPNAQHPVFDPTTDQSWMNEKIIAEYSELDCTDPASRTGGEQKPDDEPIVACAQDGSAKYILGPVELAGSHVTDASWGYETSSTGAQTNNLAVNMEFDDYGTEVFGEITTAITGQQSPYDQFAIVLDNNVLSAPQSNSPITDGRAQITGDFTEQEAETLANQLKNGALPISFQVQSEQQISPTLGADYLQKGLIAGAIGLLLVFGYSLLQYRVLGLVTISSLVVAGVLTYLLLLFCSWRYGYRLSLAGIAGVIVGIGMTADSFIVYFERIRDELRSGRKLTSAVEVGWDRAKRTIYASKSVNMMAAVILYLLAVGSVRGFAFTLGLTVIVDVLVVILFTHPMMQVLARTRFFGEGHPMSGMDPRMLGVKPAAYRGALNLDLEKAREKSASGKSAREAERRQKAKDRKLATAAAGRKKAQASTAEASAGLSLAERKAARLAEEEATNSTSSSETTASTEASTEDSAPTSVEETGGSGDSGGAGDSGGTDTKKTRGQDEED